MPKRLFLTLFLLTILGFPVLSQDAPDTCTPATGEPIRLGAVFPPETLFSADAADPYRGVKVMVEAVNECGGVNGRPVELVYIPAGNRDQVMEAVAQLQDVPLIIGSGSPAVSDALLEASRNGDFVYWEVSEPLDEGHEWAFSPRLNDTQIGIQAASFLKDNLSTLLQGEELRLAVIAENSDRSRAAAEAIRDIFSDSIVVSDDYEDSLRDSYSLSVQIRERGVNSVMVIGFSNDADQLWLNMREADANVAAWIHVGGEDYRYNTCGRLGNTDGLISISAAGQVNAESRFGILGNIYARFGNLYRLEYGPKRGEQADLSASGTVLLLRYVLPAIEGSITAGSLQSAIRSVAVDAPAGLMGEGLQFGDSGANNRAGALVEQHQNGQFCTMFPGAIATCQKGVQPFPTWRERAKLEEETICQDQSFPPAPGATPMPRV